MGKLLTAGGLAKLATTTKRTIQYYDEVGILKPHRINSKGYRGYLETQVLDFQMILLLTTLGLPLKDIHQFIKKRKKGISELFNKKKPEIEKQIRALEFNLKSIDKFLTNLKANGTMINPQIITMKPFGVYYIERTGPYAKIDKYCQDLMSMFKEKGDNFTTLAIFEDSSTYQPKKSKIKIGALANPQMRVKDVYKKEVKRLKFDPGKVITYTHNGSGGLLSLFWKELEKYCRLHNLRVKKNVPDFEVYRRVDPNPSKQFFEIYLPIY